MRQNQSNLLALPKHITMVTVADDKKWQWRPVNGECPPFSNETVITNIGIIISESRLSITRSSSCVKKITQSLALAL